MGKGKEEIYLQARFEVVQYLHRVVGTTVDSGLELMRLQNAIK